jgi:hypothetical protein
MNDYEISFIHEDFLLKCYVFADNNRAALRLAREFMIHDKGVPAWLINAVVDTRVEQK